MAIDTLEQAGQTQPESTREERIIDEALDKLLKDVADDEVLGVLDRAAAALMTRIGRVQEIVDPHIDEPLLQPAPSVAVREARSFQWPRLTFNTPQTNDHWEQRPRRIELSGLLPEGIRRRLGQVTLELGFVCDRPSQTALDKMRTMNEAERRAAAELRHRQTVTLQDRAAVKEERAVIRRLDGSTDPEAGLAKYWDDREAKNRRTMRRARQHRPAPTPRQLCLV